MGPTVQAVGNKTLRVSTWDRSVSDKSQFVARVVPHLFDWEKLNI